MTHRSIAIPLLLFLSLAPIAAQEAEITYEATELAPGLYVLEGKGGFAGGNIGLSIGEDGVVLIDDGLPPLTDTLRAAIGKLSDAPVRFLVNTHVHGDHVGGNAAFGKAGATIVAHDQLRERLLRNGLPSGDGRRPAPPEALPVLTFGDEVTIHLNGREAHVFHVAHAHTDGDVIIHWRDANVIHAGDILFNRLYPFIDLDSGGSIDGYIAAQKRILELADADTKIIAGHGPAARRDDVHAAVEMLTGARDRVLALVRAGKTKDEVLAAQPLAEYDEAWSWGFINTDRMTETLYRALTE